MAELLEGDGWTAPDSLSAYLRDALPDEYVVVADPVLQRRSYDAVVIGPCGLAILEIASGKRPTEQTREELHEKLDETGAADRARRATRALESFMADEFPALHPAVRYLRAEQAPGGVEGDWRAVEPASDGQSTLAETLIAEEPSPGNALASDTTRAAIASALRVRQLTASERTVKPFVFRSGGVLAAGQKAWTIRAAVEHIDRHPDDGMTHLANGKLARWLEAEGAHHLAALARDAVFRHKTDGRAALETFLIGTRLVERPQLSVRPTLVDVGYILEGETGTRRIRLCKGRGRGYLFGKLSTSDGWLRVNPADFSGGPVDVTVSVDTSGLLSDYDSYTTVIYADSSATDEPAAIPVRFRVVAVPSLFMQRVLRPLAWGLMAGLLGAVIGCLWTLGGIRAPGLEGAEPLNPAVPIWAVLLGLAWGILGAVCGARQPLAWPVCYAAGRWLLRTGLWAAGACAAAALIATVWSLGAADGFFDPGIRPGTAALLAAALVVFPAVYAQIAANRCEKESRGPRAHVTAGFRPPWAIAGIWLLLVALTFAPRAIGPVWQQPETQNVMQSAGGWVTSALERVNNDANDWVDQLYVRYYDRRPLAAATAPAPVRPATPFPGEARTFAEGKTP
jgi:hypothetical protein